MAGSNTQKLSEVYHHRLITAIHFDTGKVLILETLTRADYSKNRWQKSL